MLGTKFARPHPPRQSRKQKARPRRSRFWHRL